jgi:hypothetical protein
MHLTPSDREAYEKEIALLKSQLKLQEVQFQIIFKQMLRKVSEETECLMLTKIRHLEHRLEQAEA